MFPRWLTWLFLLFLGYIVLTGNGGLLDENQAPEKAAREAQRAAYYPTLHALVDGERWMRAINPTATDARPCAPQAKTTGTISSYAILEARGTGDAAECGDTIHLSVARWDSAGRASEAKNIHLVLGEQPGLDALLVGMTLNETRTLVLVIPAEGYAALPEWRAGAVALATVTRVAEKEKPDHKGPA